jgi:hypothetical protein
MNKAIKTINNIKCIIRVILIINNITKMLYFLKNLIFPPNSAFVLEEVDLVRKVVVVEDRQLSLRVEIPIGDKPLKKVSIVCPYAVLLTYEDGSKLKKKILN